MIGSKIDLITKLECEKKIIEWAKKRLSKKIYLVNVHSVVTAKYNKQFSRILNNSDISLSDGFPIVYMLNTLGFIQKERVSGPDLMSSIIPKCEKNNLSIYFYGSTLETLRLMENRIKENYPNLRFAYDSPPFRKVTSKEMELIISKINTFEPNIVFVGLGCPKQEKWIESNYLKINSVMIGVGAAFNFYAGNLKRAPLIMRNNGLEWLHRLTQEPRRLFFRYLKTNLIFIFHAGLQILKKLSVSNDR